MRRLMLCVLFALGGLALAQESTPNPLAGHAVAALLPDTVFAFTDHLVGVTYSGPVEVQADGRTVLRITLKPQSVPLPKRRWSAGDWLTVGLVGAAAAGLGYAIGQGAR